MRSTLPLLALSLAALTASGASAGGKTALLTKGASDQGVNLFFDRPAVSGDGRFVAFAGNATGVVPEDQDGNFDVFLRDRKKKKTTRISVPAAGGDADGWSHAPSISANGRFVAYASSATNLSLGGLNPEQDVFVYDRKLGSTELISVKWINVGGIVLPIGANGSCFRPSISGDGRFVAYASNADNLAVPASSTETNVYVHDRELGVTTLASQNAFHQAASDGCFLPALSADGTRVAFVSRATNLGPAVSGVDLQLYVRDLGSDVVTLVSAAPSGAQGDGLSTNPSISANGRFVGFSSVASNLVGGDTNGAQEVFVRDLKKAITHRIALDTKGNQAAAGSFDASLSGNGRYVAFSTQAPLVKSDKDGEMDVYLHDLKKGKAKRISRGKKKKKAPNGSSVDPVVDTKGRFIAFRSHASNLVNGDGNSIDDVFLHDREN